MLLSRNFQCTNEARVSGLFVCLFDLGFTLLSTNFQCTDDARVSDLFVCLI